MRTKATTGTALLPTGFTPPVTYTTTEGHPPMPLSSAVAVSRNAPEPAPPTDVDAWVAAEMDRILDSYGLAPHLRHGALDSPWGMS